MLLHTTAPADHAELRALDAALHELRLQRDGIATNGSISMPGGPSLGVVEADPRTTLPPAAVNEDAKARLRARINALVERRDPSTAAPPTTTRTTTAKPRHTTVRSNATHTTHKGPLKLPYARERQQRISLAGVHLPTNTTSNTTRPAVALPGAGLAHLIIDAELGAQNVRQRAVVSAFRWAWGAYKRCAWGQDILQPLSCRGVMSLHPSPTHRHRRAVVPAGPDHH